MTRHSSQRSFRCLAGSLSGPVGACHLPALTPAHSGSVQLAFRPVARGQVGCVTSSHVCKTGLLNKREPLTLSSTHFSSHRCRLTCHPPPPASHPSSP
ncbi:hypothetical protein HaLaN_27473 [Haematococcus lacustris]|uniref:Uncharacterized protein n=1 Tax=Haematococcus lacustris TaxID=44745 RepID=A0A6A0A8I7_HAELA|nr:hypothetical protein HaLaN_27473 [Haematococcus lacustris]